MARSLNKVQLIGNLGSDPEVRHLENDVTVANFNIATTETYTDKSGQKIDKTEWHRIVLWRGLAKVADQYLHKGDSVYIEGKIRNRSYEKDGVTRYVTEIFADNLIMLGGKGNNDTASSGNYQSNTNAVSNNQSTKVSEPTNTTEDGFTDISNLEPDDDLPF